MTKLLVDIFHIDSMKSAVVAKLANQCSFLYADALKLMQADTVKSVFTKVYTPCPKKTCDYIFYNNFNNKCPITIIFGIVSSKSMCHRNLVSFSTSPI